MADLGMDWVGIFLRGVTLVLWLATLLGVAGVAFWRLGTTRAGLALGGGFGLWALQQLVVSLFSVIVPRMGLDYSLVVVGQAALGLLFSLGALALIALGLWSLPAALGGPRAP